MTRDGFHLPPPLLERVLQRLGFQSRPKLAFEPLRRLYTAWCQRVPFDNLRKLIHVRAGDPGPLPGDDPVDFFEGWLRHGAGGTCWAANGALHALLRSLSFDARRGLGTMLAAPNLPPNHGTVIVLIDARRYLLDASILHGEPLPLDEHAPTQIVHGAWGVRCERRGRNWFVHWRPLHTLSGLECRIERLRVSATEFQQRHERSRPWSPFNYSVYARSNRGDAVIGVAFGRQLELDGGGDWRQTEISAPQRAQFLIERLGIGAQLVERLPLDLPLPPPPESVTARGRRAAAAG
ncbi:MAG: arylamine N-acetyltransferase [Steroidobacteraceae bacterium]